MNLTEVITILLDPSNQFLRLSLLMGIIASVSFGIIGTYVVTRRISYLAGAISHCAFGGIGAGLYLQKKVGLAWLDPMYGAVFFALASALTIGVVTLKAKQREDTVIGALWATGMAAGLLFADITPGYFDLSSYLFGDILLVSGKDLVLVGLLDLLVVGVAVYFYNTLLAVCFDEEYTRLRGVNSAGYYLLLLCLTALTVVLLIRIVGIVLVIALVTLPAATAGHFARRLWQMMVLSILLCMIFVVSGLLLSYALSLSGGPSIIMIAGVTYMAVVGGSKIMKKNS